MNTNKRQNFTPLQGNNKKVSKKRHETTRIDKALVTRFQYKIWNWYRENAPSLPWRETHNPYHIFISEVMLQQTQIPRVLQKYPLFLKKFPTLQSLAKAPLRTVLATWHGMGYNRRALYLKHAAEQMYTHAAGTLPRNEEQLRALPGIGPYTARAILCFAYDICNPFIETNIRRVIIHEFFPNQEKVSDIDILKILQYIQPQASSLQCEWYWALMDYGRDALQKVPNPNHKSRHYVKQTKFEGSPRYIRAKLISYLLTNKKATEEELFLSLKEDQHLADISPEDITRTLGVLKKENLIKKSRPFFSIA